MGSRGGVIEEGGGNGSGAHRGGIDVHRVVGGSHRRDSAGTATSSSSHQVGMTWREEQKKEVVIKLSHELVTRV